MNEVETSRNIAQHRVLRLHFSQNLNIVFLYLPAWKPVPLYLATALENLCHMVLCCLNAQNRI